MRLNVQERRDPTTVHKEARKRPMGRHRRDDGVESDEVDLGMEQKTKHLKDVDAIRFSEAMQIYLGDF